jgi:hypothetical protein
MDMSSIRRCKRDDLITVVHMDYKGQVQKE